MWPRNPCTRHPLDAIEAAANARDVPCQSSVKVWLRKKVEHQELLPLPAPRTVVDAHAGQQALAVTPKMSPSGPPCA